MSRGVSGSTETSDKNLPIRLIAVEFVYSVKTKQSCKMFSWCFEKIYVIIVCCESTVATARFLRSKIPLFLLRSNEHFHS